MTTITRVPSTPSGQAMPRGARTALAALVGAACLMAMAAPAAASQPTWAKGLGPGVVVVPPAKYSPGWSSPGQVTQAFIDAMDSKKQADVCKYYYPTSTANDCKAEFKATPHVNVEYKDMAITYVAIKATKALVGTTGQACQLGTCATNHDPSAIFATGKSFSAQWEQAVAASNSSAVTYSLLPVIEVSGKWYIYAVAS